MPIKFKTSVQLKPSELDIHLEDHLMKKLQLQYEGVCSMHGFIKPGSLRMVERSLGQLMKSHFNGYVRFEMVVMADVCNPMEGSVVTAVVRNKNQMGILAESAVRGPSGWIPVLDIIVPKRSAGISSSIPLDTLEIGDMFQVEVLGKRFQLNDHKISIIGRGVPNAEEVLQRRRQAVQVQEPTMMEVAEPEWEEEATGDPELEEETEDQEGGMPLKKSTALDSESEEEEDELVGGSDVDPDDIEDFSEEYIGGQEDDE